jgi:hypothetical protein
MKSNSSFKQSCLNIIKNSIRNSLKSIFFILKITIPITFIVKLLVFLNVIPTITLLFKPLMSLFGLPGHAALVLVTSNLMNIYGGLAVMASFPFTIKEVTIMAIMILFSHSLLVECSVIKGLKVSIKKQLLLRIGAALLSGILLNLIMGNHFQAISQNALVEKKEIPPFLFQWDHFLVWSKALFIDYGVTMMNSILSLLWIISLILFVLEILKEFHLLEKLNTIFYPLTKHLGLSKSATTSLMVGLFIGITYGAGTILLQYQEGKLTKKDVLLVSTFLLLCHSLLEDVILFIRQGAVAWIILIYKIPLAIIVTYFYNKLLMRKEDNQVSEMNLELKTS